MRAGIRCFAGLLGSAVALLLSCATQAAEFRSVANAAALLYDAPASTSNKIAILTRGYPVEVVSQSGEWVRVRDASGQLLWVSASALSSKRTVSVAVQVAEVRRAPEPTAPLLMRAEREVMLELMDAGTAAWVRVRHPGGIVGYIRAEQVWGL